MLRVRAACRAPRSQDCCNPLQSRRKNDDDKCGYRFECRRETDVCSQYEEFVTCRGPGKALGCNWSENESYNQAFEDALARGEKARVVLSLHARGRQPGRL